LSQSRAMSFVESCANVAIGYLVALASQLLVFPIYGIHVDLTTNLYIGAWFTVISIIRSYCVRRGFNRIRGSRAPQERIE
jgi:hypothetical protein